MSSAWTPNPQVAAYMDEWASGSAAENWRDHMVALPANDDQAGWRTKVWAMAQYELLERLYTGGMLKPLG